MKGRTLQSELLAWQILVTSSACVILVGGTMLAAYLLMRRGQDHTLLQLGATMCHGIDAELNEHDSISLSDAARDFLVEVKADGGKLAEELRRLGAEVKFAGKEGENVMTVTLTEAMKPRDVLVAARGREVQVRGLEVARESMEQAFLRVINSGEAFQ